MSNTKTYFHSEFYLGTKACANCNYKWDWIKTYFNRKESSEINILSQGHIVLDQNHWSHSRSISHTRPVVWALIKDVVTKDQSTPESHRSWAGVTAPCRHRTVSPWLAAGGFCGAVLPPGATSPAGAVCACSFASSAVTGQCLPGHSVSSPAAYPHDKLPLPVGQLLRDFLLLTDTD